ncbi:MAG: hypothetical protein H0Z32_14985 [Bacillaceae bacterium]|nr:hypothetical protein [Bacillaceae bacterium]
MMVILGCSDQADSEYTFVIPDDFKHSEAVIHEIVKETSIQEIQSSKFMALFHTEPTDAMFIQTEAGVIELIHFPKKNGQNYRIELIKTKNGRHQYTIKNGADEAVLDSSEKLFIHQTPEYIAFTKDEDVHRILSHIF